jgi:hypothetical protein
MASTTGANNNNKSRPSNSYENNEEAWETELAKANRSALIVIRNLTSESLFRIKFSLIHGMWRKFPPEIIEPNQEVRFGSESKGFMTGTEGSLELKMWEGQDPFIFHWVNPFFASATMTVKGPNNYRVAQDVTSKAAMKVVLTIHDPYEHSEIERNQLVVSQAPVIYDLWKLELKKSAKSVMLRIHNSYTKPLILQNAVLRHGIWGLIPPERIDPDTFVEFGAQSHGMTGSAGTFAYSFSKEHKIGAQFTWRLSHIKSTILNALHFAEENTVVGDHCEIVLHFSSDEAYALEENEEQKEADPQSSNNSDIKE